MTLTTHTPILDYKHAGITISTLVIDHHLILLPACTTQPRILLTINYDNADYNKGYIIIHRNKGLHHTVNWAKTIKFEEQDLLIITH